jgi:hypothetical protein
MDDTDFTRLKIITEADLGRELDADEEHALKMLYYFGKACRLKHDLDSGPQHISEVLPAVISAIKSRSEQRANLENAKQQ